MSKFFCYVFFFIFLVFSNYSKASLYYVEVINKQNWVEAKKFNDSVLAKLTLWLMIVNGYENDFYTVAKFIEENPKWPKQDLLHRKLEESDFSKAKTNDIITWFNKHPTKNLSTRKNMEYLS